MTVDDARLRVLLIGHGRMGRLVEQLAGECGVDIVGHLTRNRASVVEFPIGVIAAPNFAIGVNAFAAICERAAELLVGGHAFAPWVHEAHHAAKKDAPSGTAIALQRVIEAAGGKSVDVASTRAGYIPGTHTVGFDNVGEGITLTHTARDRTPFARGALEAARWINGRRGWFTMRDMLGL